MSKLAAIDKSPPNEIEYPAIEFIESTALKQAEGRPLSSTSRPSSLYKGTNHVPRTHHGTTIHMDLKEREISARVLTVGDPARAKSIARNLDAGYTVKSSSRGFTTYNGRFLGVPVSIVAIGMGMAMADFLVRESRQIIDGKFLIVRFGTCGSLRPDIPAGSVVVASEGSVMVARNHDAFLEDDEVEEEGSKASSPRLKPYLLFKPQPADERLSEALVRELSAELGPSLIRQGLNVSADSFYSSQGREDPRFDDRSKGVLDMIRASYPNVMSMEMETFQLFSLANSSRGTIIAAAAAIAIANRPTGEVCCEEVLSRLELEGGRAALRAMNLEIKSSNRVYI